MRRRSGYAQQHNEGLAKKALSLSTTALVIVFGVIAVALTKIMNLPSQEPWFRLLVGIIVSLLALRGGVLGALAVGRLLDQPWYLRDGLRAGILGVVFAILSIATTVTALLIVP